MLSVEHGFFGKSLSFFPHCFRIFIISICFRQYSSRLSGCEQFCIAGRLHTLILVHWLQVNTSIVTLLSLYHGIHITVRKLKYLVNFKYNLRRRNNESTAHEIRRAVRYELNGPGCLMGYRSMTRCLRTTLTAFSSNNFIFEENVILLLLDF